jgi:hypothetical protein
MTLAQAACVLVGAVWAILLYPMVAAVPHRPGAGSGSSRRWGILGEFARMVALLLPGELGDYNDKNSNTKYYLLIRTTRGNNNTYVL